MNEIIFAPVNIIHVAIISIVLFSLFLVMGKSQYKALAALLIILAVENIFNILEELGITRHIHLITPAVTLAYGPVYYLFAKNLVYGGLSLRKHALHFLPAILALPFTIWWIHVLQVSFIILVIYIIMTFRLLNYYHQVLAEVTADSESHTLRWLSLTLAVIFALSIIDFTRMNLQLTLSLWVLTRWYFISTAIILTYTCYLVIKAVRQPMLYSGIADFERNAATTQQQDGNSNEQEAALEHSSTLFKEIDDYVQSSHAYRQAKYSLRNLAEDLGLDQREVSLAINTVGEKSFSDYINAFRVKEVIHQITVNKDQYSLLEIGLNAGFNSKSSFNAVFKKLTGFTPSQYPQ